LRTLLIDIDNTIGNLISHYLKYYNNLYNANFKISCLDTFDTIYFPEYTSTLYSSPEEEKKKLIEIFNSKGFWESLPLLEKSDEVLKELNTSYNIYLLTSPSFNSTYFFTERIKWVKKNLPFFDYEKLIFCSNKNLFKSDYILIDDYPKNLKNFEGKTIKIKYPFNHETKTDGEFFPSEWEKVPDILKLI
jgi:5'(3')-deoxyribonucleotidase